MDIFLQLNNRELAIIILGIIFFTIVSIYGEGVFKGFISVVKGIFHYKLLLGRGLFSIRIVIGCSILYQFHLRNIGFLKDTIIWLLFGGIPILFNIEKDKINIYFKKILIQTISIYSFIEFITNLYTFGLIIEIILVLLTTVLGLILAYIPYDKNQKSKILIKPLQLTIGIIFIIVLINNIIHFKEILTINNLFNFLLSLFLTLWSLPYFYFFALFLRYESLLIVIKGIVRNSKQKNLYRNIKKDILKAGGINFKNIDKISRIPLIKWASTDHNKLISNALGKKSNNF